MATLVRNSERATYKACRQRWHWSYEKGFETRHRRTALTFGTIAHDSLAGWYVPGRKRGTHPADTFRELYIAQPEDFDQWDDEGNKVPALDLGVSMMEGYVEHFGEDPMIEIIESEMPFQIDVYDKDGTYLATLVGRFDAIGINLRTERIFIFEHKTMKSFKDIHLLSRYGEQGLSYWWAANYWLRHQGILKDDQWVQSIGYNLLRKAMPDDRPVNEDGYALNKPTKDSLKAACADAGLPVWGTVADLRLRLAQTGLDPDVLGEISARQPQPRYKRQEVPLKPQNLETFNRRLRRELMEMELVRKRKLPIFKNPSGECDWCPFRDVCELHEMGGDWKDVLMLEFKKWDPYSDHELHLELAT